MSDNKLEIIDFSNGIKQKEIQYNFDVLQDQIKDERRAVGGAGISYGFNFVLDDFNLTIKEGRLVANDGKEVYIDETNIKIELPILIERTDQLQMVDEFNRIYLSDKPYATTRRTTADNAVLDYSGIKVVLSEDNQKTLSIANIDGNYITLNDYPELDSRKIDVFYNTTYKRRDVIFIDSNYKLQYRQGITSPSPSIPEIKDEDVLYMLGYLQIDGFTFDDDGKEYASVKFIKNFSSIRNIYSDKDNKLYLCGIPFDSLKTIHVVEPTDPDEYALWYDSFSNELKIWRHTDTSEFADAFKFTSSNPNHPQNFTTNIKYKYGMKQLRVFLNGKELIKEEEYEEASDLTELQKEDSSSWSKEFRIIKKLSKGDTISYVITRYDGYAEWIAINNKSYNLCQERYVWTPQYLKYFCFMFNHDLQHFFFDSKTNRNMLYTPNKNCLEILIDNIPLHADQFEEITINDALMGEEASYIRKELINNYGYRDDFEEYKIAENYENIGIGFKLGAQLDKNNVTIEARVTHRVNSNPIAKRFQRSATFVAENSIVYEKYIKSESGIIEQETVFTCTSPFRYQENQLEVYLNGIKLVNGVDFIEYAKTEDDKGTNLFQFKVLKNLNDKDRVSYKITSTVYSYDHVENLLKEFKDEISSNESTISYCKESIKKIQQNVDDYTEEIRSHIETIDNIETNFDSKYLSKSAKLDKDNLAKNIYEGITRNVINTNLTVVNPTERIDVTDIFSINDFVLIVNVNSNRILCRDIDYSIEKEDSYNFLKILSSNVNVSDILNVSGIRFNNSGNNE